MTHGMEIFLESALGVLLRNIFNMCDGKCTSGLLKKYSVKIFRLDSSRMVLVYLGEKRFTANGLMFHIKLFAMPFIWQFAV